MLAVNAASSGKKTVASPNAAYESMQEMWRRSRAACSGEKYVKSYDGVIDTINFRNLLIPFSPSMTQHQYNFYKAEAEYPGIVAQYAKILVGGLLRKKPQLSLPDSAPKEAADWIMNSFGQDDAPLSAFLDEALWEELQTSRAWIYVDYPNIPDREKLTNQDFKKFKPYPILWDCESVINWRVTTNSSGKQVLDKVIVRGYSVVFGDGDKEFHPDYVDTVWVHELIDGRYQVRVFKEESVAQNVPVVNGQQTNTTSRNTPVFKLAETKTGYEMNGKPLDFIPAWPLNGSIEPNEPMLTPIVDKEIALYNKMSRRNHLLYGAATYTPVVSSDMSDERFAEIVGAGLGSWIHLGMGETADVLKTPTDALADMEKSIASNIEEMAKLGIRMLTPDTDQSGVALEIRNASQTAQLGTLNMKISSTMAAIIAFMLNWRYDLDLKVSDISFTLSSDFNPTPLGADWLRLVTEWYQNGLIPRDIWLTILKINDIVPPDYDDEEGKSKINEDELIKDKLTSSLEDKLAKM